MKWVIKYFFLSALRGTRGQITWEEYIANYFHSHLSSKCTDNENCLKTTTFCTGSNETNDLLAQLMSEYTEELFELYLLTINSMMEWESLEGSPYIRMNTVGLKSREEITLSRVPYSSLNLIPTHNMSGINFYYNSGRYGVVIDSKFEELLKKSFIEMYT